MPSIYRHRQIKSFHERVLLTAHLCVPNEIGADPKKKKEFEI